MRLCVYLLESHRVLFRAGCNWLAGGFNVTSLEKKRNQEKKGPWNQDGITIGNSSLLVGRIVVGTLIWRCIMRHGCARAAHAGFFCRAVVLRPSCVWS